MSTARRSNGRRKATTQGSPGFYFFPSDWLSDEALQRCGFAARGFWLECLCRAWREHPRGVLPGDLGELALVFGVPREVAKYWAAEVGPLVAELEAAGVFSRGSDVHEKLAPNAIVNRRMFGEFLAQNGRSEAARKAALYRHHGISGIMRIDADTHADGYADCDADGSSEGGVCEEVASRASAERDAKGVRSGCYFPTQPNLTQLPKSSSGVECNSTDGDLRWGLQGEGSPSVRARSEAESVGSVLRSAGPVASGSSDADPGLLRAYVERAVAVTGDATFRKAGHAGRIGRLLQHPSGRREIDALLTRVERDAAESARGVAGGGRRIRDPARVVTAALGRLEEELGVRP